MPKVIRIMKVDTAHAHLPKIGSEFGCLGVRDNEIELDSEQMVQPGIKKGMSVFDSIEALPPLMVPKQYASQVEGAAGSRNQRIWTMGRGAFISGLFAPGLQLDCDDAHYGRIEAEKRMHHSEYRKLLADTQATWEVVQPI